MVTNSGYTNLISNLLLEPYQMKLLTRYRAKKSDNKKEAKELSLAQAKDELRLNLQKEEGDSIKKDIDSFLAKLLGEPEDIDGGRLDQRPQGEIKQEREKIDSKSDFGNPAANSFSVREFG